MTTKGGIRLGHIRISQPQGLMQSQEDKGVLRPTLRLVMM